MTAMRNLKAAAIGMGLLLAPTMGLAAGSKILFILDASGSMAGKVDGKAKMDTAKTALAKLLTDLPKDTEVGLMVYGHRERKSCTDVEVMIPISKTAAGAVGSLLQAISPTGKTPIAYALEQTSGAFVGLEKGNNNVVLISDGIETCDGDPCAVAGALANSNVNLRVHVVGFDISQKDRQQLECIARLGKGKYFPANSTEGFASAVTQAVQVAQVQKTPPAPQRPQFTEVFRDDFNGEALAEHWEVINPDTDSYIVEDGFLTILTSKAGILMDRGNKLQNLLRLNKPLPKGNWRITMRIKPGVTTFRESYSLAFYTDKDNFLAATAYAGVEAWKGHVFVNLYGNKVAKGKDTQFSKPVINSKKAFGHRTYSKNPKPYTDWAKANIKALYLRIQKTGRSYFISSMIEGKQTTGGGEKPQWVGLEKLTSLRLPGKRVAFFIGQQKFTNRHQQLGGGETLAQVDWITIEKAQ